MEPVGCQYGRLAIAFAVLLAALGAPARAGADPGVTAFPGMEIRQGGTVCMVALVEPRLRVAVTSGQCGSGEAAVTDHNGHPLGTVVLARRQTDDDAAVDGSMSPVGYEVIALAPDVRATDVLPTGRQLKSTPGLRARPGLPVCQFRSSGGQRCGSIGSVSNGRFVIADTAVDSRDFGGPVYALTDDGSAVIVGLFEGIRGSEPEMESWQAIMQQVYIDGRTQSQPQQPSDETRTIGRHSGDPFPSP